jgi:formate hydrogenlyase transcriptional activator
VEDIGLLVRHFSEYYGKRMNKRIKGISLAAMKAMACHSWPWNVRELQNVIERAVILSPGKILRPALADLEAPAGLPSPSKQEQAVSPGTLKEAEREYILRALTATNWVLGGPRGAGARLGLPRTTLISKMERLGISRSQAPFHL